jgi:hypothetical protein
LNFGRPEPPIKKGKDLNAHAKLCAAVACAAVFPLAVLGQDGKPDDGTDPTKLNTSFSFSYEAINLANGGDVQSLFLKYGAPISADGLTGINFKIPLVSTSFGESSFGVGDASVKLTRVLAVMPSYGIVLGAEALFNTADAPDRGAGVDVLKLSGVYAIFFNSGAIFAPSLLQTVSIGSRDPGRAEVNLTTIDLYYVPKLDNPRAYMTLDPAILYDWENDRMSGALSVTYGQSVDLGLPGNESFFIKPSTGVGGNRGADLGLEVGFKVVGF